METTMDKDNFNNYNSLTVFEKDSNVVNDPNLLSHHDERKTSIKSNICIKNEKIKIHKRF